MHAKETEAETDSADADGDGDAGVHADAAVGVTEDETVLDRRDRRALVENLVVVNEAPDLYHVYSEDGNRYVVDTRVGACTCPDFQYRATECKHIRRARLEAGEYDTDALAADVEAAFAEVDEEIERLAGRRAELVTFRRALAQFE